ncbi:MULTISPECIES: putative quorum-sensing-regulated virulence factor [unclassified Carboxylicivirga]|uniref:putative quorum-sensing-regulated virulence factor n=1 Tax=Carboxylicivirga TaxID=1628153 RepID=UPI003D3340BB
MTLTDNDPMPYGKHQGKPMIDVPASYLMWLWENNKVKKTSGGTRNAVYWYIHENLDVIEKELNEQNNENEI